MKKSTKKAWFKALAGLSINISAAWIALPFIGVNLALPDTLFEFLLLLADIFAGIIFLLLAVWFERKLEK